MRDVPKLLDRVLRLLVLMALAVQPGLGFERNLPFEPAARGSRTDINATSDRRGAEPGFRRGMDRAEIAADRQFSRQVDRIAIQTGLTRNADARTEDGSRVYYDRSSGAKLLTISPSNDGSRTSVITIHQQDSRMATIGVKTDVGTRTTNVSMAKGEVSFFVTAASARFGVAAEAKGGREMLMENRAAMQKLSPGAPSSIDAVARAAAGSTLAMGVHVFRGLPAISYSGSAPVLKAGRGFEGGVQAANLGTAIPQAQGRLSRQHVPGAMQHVGAAAVHARPHAARAPSAPVAPVEKSAAPAANAIANRPTLTEPAADVGATTPPVGGGPARAISPEAIPEVAAPAAAALPRSPLAQAAPAAVPVSAPEAPVVAAPAAKPSVPAADVAAPVQNAAVAPINALPPDKAASANTLLPALSALSQVVSGRDKGTDPARIETTVVASGRNLSPQTGAALSGLVTTMNNPKATQTEMFAAVKTANTELQKSGIYLHVSVPQAEGTGGKQAVNLAVYKISGVETHNALGSDVPVFQLTRVGGVGEVSPGFHPHESNYAFVTNGPLNAAIMPSSEFLAGAGNFALGMTTNAGVQPAPGSAATNAPMVAKINDIVRENVVTVGPERAASLLRTSIGDHEAFHAAFETQGGEKNAKAGDASAVQEHGAYTHWIAKVDASIMPLALTILANQTSNPSNSGTQVGSTRALLSLQRQIPDVKFISDTGKIDVQGFAKLLTMDPVRVQAAASAAVQLDIVKPYLPRT